MVLKPLNWIFISRIGVRVTQEAQQNSADLNG